MKSRGEILQLIEKTASHRNVEFVAIEELLSLLVEVQMDTRDQLIKLTNVIHGASIKRETKS